MRRLPASLAVALAGCAVRAGVGALPDGARDGPAADLPGDLNVDAATDATGPCPGRPFGAPVLLEGVNDPNSDDWTGALSADQLTLFFSSWRDGGQGNDDLWVATRPDFGTPFGPPRALTALNTVGAERGPCLSADDLTLIFASDRPGSQGSLDLWIATRSSLTADFGSPAPLTEVNSDSWEAGCALSDDGLTLYLGSTRGGGSGSHDLWVARRSGPAAAFAAPVPLASINTPDRERGASLSPDGLELFFASDRSGGQGGLDLWVARRLSLEASFDAATNLGQLNTAGDDTSAVLSRDGRTLFYNRDADVAGSATRANIWIAPRLCP